MDFVAASFVRNAAQVEEIRAHIKVRGRRPLPEHSR